MQRKITGKVGEKIARQYFLDMGARLVAQNWHCRYGELDLVVIKDGKLIFVEVKSKISNRFGYAVEALTRKQLKRITKSCFCFLQEMTLVKFTGWRIDLIALELDSNHKLIDLQHFKSIYLG